MKAIVVSAFGDESVLEYKETPTPAPGAGEVRIRVGAAGVNPVETYIRSGAYAKLPELPYTPGNDGAGVVDAVGPGVTRLAEGARVFVAASLARRNTGTYAEYVVCDADAVHALPPSLPFSQGAGLGTPGLAAANALFARGGLNAGETVLVHGASGGVGTLAVQLARRAGARVIATAGSRDGMDLATYLGAHHVFNHREDGYESAIVAAAGGRGPDLVIEMLANVNLGRDLALIARYGRVVVVGNRGSLDFNPRDVMAKDAVVRGMMVNNMTREEYTANMFRLAAGLETGMRVAVDKELPLEQAAEAHKLALAPGRAGKIILSVGV